MRNILTLLCSLAICLTACTGCASIVSKSNYPVNITSQPSDADITIVNKKGRVVYEGKTPTIVDLKAGAGFFQGQDYVVTFNKDGYETQTAQIERKLDNWYLFGNIAVGGFIGWLIVDPITGAMWVLEDVNVNLQPKPGSYLPTENKLYIVSLDQVPINLRPRMVRIR